MRGKQMAEIDIEQLLAEGKTIQIKPQGYSMYPMFVPGRDEAILQRADVQKLQRGDVVLYRRTNSILVLHRIARRTEDGFYMVGDNQIKMEGPIACDQIRGFLVGFVRKGTYHTTQERLYRVVAGIWLWLRPVRRWITVPIAACKKVFYFFKRLST